MSRSGETNGRFFNGLASENFLSTKTIELQSPTVVAHANKKPSYLNLACCVNGYSNYTNYDSIERREINKSREVSPNRPIIMSRKQHSNDNLLSVPMPVTFVKHSSPLTSIQKRFASLNITDKDTTDNASMTTNGNGSVTTRKSFIQQRVEKLYGTTKILTSVKSSDSIQLNGNGTIHHTNGSTNGSSNGTSLVDEKENDEISMNSLPVMKHLNGRPEFCKQLQFMNSPKKSLTRTSTGNVLLKSDQKKVEELKSDVNSGNTNIEIVTSGNTAVTSNEIQITNEIPSIDLSKFESVKKDCEIHMDQVVSCDVSSVVSEVKVTNGHHENGNGIAENNNTMEPEFNSPKAEIKDGNYFLKLVHTEKMRILKIADDTEKELLQLQSDVSWRRNFFVYVFDFFMFSSF